MNYKILNKKINFKRNQKIDKLGHSFPGRKCPIEFTTRSKSIDQNT